MTVLCLRHIIVYNKIKLYQPEELTELLKSIGFKKIKLINPDPKPFDEIKEIIGHPEHKYIADCLRKKIMPEGLIETDV